MKRVTALCLLIFAISGCASMKDSILFGAGVGAAGGLGIGSAVEPSVGSALIGTAVGGIIGGAIGYLGHKSPKGNESPSSEKDGNLRAVKPLLKNDLPSLLTPEASCTEVDERVEGSIYFGPQIRCTIEKNAVWSVK
jgi:Na+/glutamate symporter